MRKGFSEDQVIAVGVADGEIAHAIGAVAYGIDDLDLFLQQGPVVGVDLGDIDAEVSPADGFFDALVTGTAKMDGDFVCADTGVIAEDKGLLKAQYGGVVQ